MPNYLYPIVAIILGIMIMMFPLFTYRKEDKKLRFSFLNCFPYEVVTNYRERIWILVVGTIFVMFAGQSYIVTFIHCTNPMYQSVMYLAIVSYIVFLGNFTFGLDHYKTHIIMDLVSFLTQIGASVTLFIAVVPENIYPTEINSVIGIIMGVVGMLLFMLLFIPQLKKWMYLDKCESDGKTIYIRPRYCALSIVEWVFFIAGLFNLALLVVNSIII